MAKFGIQRAPERLRTTGATGVRASLDVGTGEGAIAGAMAGLGGAVSNLGLKYDLKQANTQFSEYKSNVGLDREVERIEIKNEIDIDKHTEIAKKHKAVREGLLSSLTNKRGQQAAMLWENQQEPLRLAEFNESRQSQLRDNERTAIFAARQEVLRNPETLGEFEKQLARTMFVDKNNPDGTSPTFSQEEAAKILADTRKMAVVGNITNLYRSGGHAEARKVLEASSLSAPEKENLDDEIDADERSTLSSNKLNKEAAIEAVLQDVDDIITLPQDEFLASASEMLRKINESKILPVKGKNGAGKEGQRKKINDRIKAISEGKIDPINQFDPSEYTRLERLITQNSMMVKGTDITSRVGFGQDKGITTAQSKDLTALKKFYDGADILGTDLHRIYSGAIIGLRTSKTFSKNKADNVLYAARASSVLNAWAVKNPNATESDYQAFFDRLMDRSFMDNWGRGWFIREKEEQRVAVRENIQAFEEELGIEIMPTITTKAERDKLKKGTKYKDSKGNIATKK